MPIHRRDETHKIHHHSGPCDQGTARNGICVTKRECDEVGGRLLEGDLRYGTEDGVHCCAIRNCSEVGSYCDWWCPTSTRIGLFHNKPSW